MTCRLRQCIWGGKDEGGKRRRVGNRKKAARCAGRFHAPAPSAGSVEGWNWEGSSLGARNNGNVLVYKCVCTNNHSLHSHLSSLFALTTPARSVGPTSETSPEPHLSSTSLRYTLDQLPSADTGLRQCSPNWFPCVSSRCSIKPILFTWTRGISQWQKADQATVLLHTLWRPYHDPLAWMIWPLCMVSKLISSTLFIPTPPDTQIPSLCLQHDKPIFQGRSLNAHSACYSFAHSSFLLAPSGFFRSHLLREAILTSCL